MKNLNYSEKIILRPEGFLGYFLVEVLFYVNKLKKEEILLKLLAETTYLNRTIVGLRPIGLERVPVHKTEFELNHSGLRPIKKFK